MKQYPADFRDHLVRAIDAGLAEAEAARCVGVHPETIARWHARRVETGSAAPARRPGRPPRIPPAQHGALRAQVAAHPDATLAEHGPQWERDQETVVRSATMSRTLARLGLTLKKSPSWPGSKTPPNERLSGRRWPRSTRLRCSSATRRAPRPR